MPDVGRAQVASGNAGTGQPGCVRRTVLSPLRAHFHGRSPARRFTDNRAPGADDARPPRGLGIARPTPPRNRAHFSLWLDLEVMLSIGGRERTAAEYGDLLARGGFQLRRVVATAGQHSIIEAVPV